ncbi:unnamed protein product [Phytophthora fragariaefolia]|uniref:Unnamed protein product n=1 Tax=Phytophthora fragariaefolia TaxID=1490495 RepID=A0A9W6Y0G1_9STRA|nr:unnamed protein product [Phytophthora fragariaefolia]
MYPLVHDALMWRLPECVAPLHAEVANEDFGLSTRRINASEDQQEQNKSATVLVTEADVLANIGAPLECVSGAALSVPPETTKEEIGSSVMRFIARLTVYEMLKDYKNGELVTEGLVEQAPGLDETNKELPMREEVPLVDWEQFRLRASCLAEKLALPNRCWDILSKWAERYYSENAPNIWNKL